MIDWVTASLPLTHEPINSGVVCKINPDGGLDWASPCRFSVQGSFESNVQVRSTGSDGAGQATHLHFSGNPSKFLQGHNVFGSDDLVSLMLDTYMKIVKSLKLTPTLQDYSAIKSGDYELKMVDINHSFVLPSRADVLAWIRAAEFKSKTRHGRPTMTGGTLYWGKKSLRWALKCYSKGQEIEAPKHKLPYELQHTDIASWAENKLRIELRLKRKELTNLNIEKAKDLTIKRTNELFNMYLRKLEMNEQIALSTEEQLKLPRGLQSTYLHWKDGQDLRAILSKNTFYKHRRELLKYGLDITIRPEKNSSSNVIPLIRILEAKPAQVPHWAFEQNLVHHSARSAVS